MHAYNARSVRRSVEAGVKVIEHGQLLDEATVKLLGDKGIFLSLQALDPAPPWAPANIREKKDEVIRGTDNAFRWAKQHKVKLLWGTDFLFNPEQNKNQNKDILKLKQWFTPAEVLKLLTFDNAQVFHPPRLAAHLWTYTTSWDISQQGRFYVDHRDPSHSLDRWF